MSERKPPNEAQAERRAAKARQTAEDAVDPATTKGERQARRRARLTAGGVAEADPWPPTAVRLLRRHLVFAEALPVNYLINPKAGCTTVQLTLTTALRARTGDKAAALSRFKVLPDIVLARSVLAKPTFSMVRNPYSRVLSCYLSKIASPGPLREKLATWTKFRRQFSLAPNAAPSFADFLKFIEQDEKRDPHWELQTLNLVQPAARVHRLFYLERVSELSAWLEGALGSTVQTDEAGRYGATDKIAAYYDAGSLARVRRMYAVDFETFGYGDDPAQQAPVQPVDFLPGAEGALEAVIGSALHRSERRLARRAALSRAPRAGG